MVRQIQRPEDIDRLLACPRCDALHRAAVVAEGAQAACSRCGTVLLAPREGAFFHVIALALTVAILLVAAVFFPFLRLRLGQVEHGASILDAVRSFSTGAMVPLSVAVACLIVLIPLVRALALVYVLWPLARGRAGYAAARPVFRLAEALRPWSMAEVFVIGVAVALVKVAGLAQVTLGPAFWAFAALVLVSVLQDNAMCRWTIWQALDPARS